MNGILRRLSSQSVPVGADPEDDDLLVGDQKAIKVAADKARREIRTALDQVDAEMGKVLKVANLITDLEAQERQAAKAFEEDQSDENLKAWADARLRLKERGQVTSMQQQVLEGAHQKGYRVLCQAGQEHVPALLAEAKAKLEPRQQFKEGKTEQSPTGPLFTFQKNLRDLRARLQYFENQVLPEGAHVSQVEFSVVRSRLRKSIGLDRHG